MQVWHKLFVSSSQNNKLPKIDVYDVLSCNC